MATKVNPEETALPWRVLKAQGETPGMPYPDMLLVVRAATLNAMPGD